jgi:membrane protein DedA with SNARE-associated domain
MQEVITWLVTTIGVLGYPGIFILMTIESSAFPFPSEIIMTPAGYLAYKGEMNMALVILCGTAGSLAGAYINYFAARYLGRPLLLKYGKYVFLTEHKFSKAEVFFRKHGEISTFIGRLLPGVRQIISLPAGLAGMNHAKFALYTAAGAGIWVTVLAWIGYLVGSNEALVMQYARQAVIGAVVLSVIIAAVYVWYHKRSRSSDSRIT